jgi:hypothetical protein
MKARGENTVYALALLMIVYLLLPTCMTYAAPAAAQKGTQGTLQMQPPAIDAAAKGLNPNAPPKGTITLNASSKANVNGSTWYQGSYQFIQWTCSGTNSNFVDVTLWQNNNKVAVIDTANAAGQTAYTVPNNMALGSYQLRITLENDPRVAAQQVVTVSAPTITIVAPAPNEVLYTGTQYRIMWGYNGNGNPGQVYVTLNAASSPHGKKNPDLFGTGNGPCGSLSPVTATGGVGSAVWTLPQNAGNLPNPFYIFVTNAENENIWAVSGPISVACKKPTIACGQNQICVDVKTDNQNCGACGNGCAGTYGGQCVNGSCVCLSPYAWCGKFCADLLNDNFNCGACGKSCGGNTKCVNGSCVCASPYVMCGNSCTDLQWDNNNCGQCGNVCNALPYCQQGVCTAGHHPGHD